MQAAAGQLVQTHARPSVPCRVRPFTSFSQTLRAAPLYKQYGQASRSCRLNAVTVSATAVAPEQMKIRIKLKSYWVDLLQYSVDQIREAADTTGARLSGPVQLPTKRKIFTVLRSPHVNKDAREQFEFRVHQRLIDVKDLSAETVEKLMELDLPAGVDVQVKL